MWDYLNDPWRACLHEAWSAYCHGTVPIGAVVADADEHIVARGRNRIHDQHAEPPFLQGIPLAHAELNALIQIRREMLTGVQLALYTTMEPCPLCFGAFHMSGIRDLHYAARDPYAGSTNLLGTTPYLGRKPIRLHPPLDPMLECLILAMHVEFILRRMGDRADGVLEFWQPVVPHSIEAGSMLFTTNQLLHLRAQAASVEQVVDALAGAIAAYI